MDKFYCYCPDTGFDTFELEGEARQAAQDSIDYYRDNASEGWDEEVEQVSWGEITQVVGTPQDKPLTKELRSELGITCKSDTLRDYHLVNIGDD